MCFNSVSPAPPGWDSTWRASAFGVHFAMAPHSSTVAWKIPWTKEPGGLQSMGLLRVRHDWAPSLSLFTFLHWRRKWKPTPVFLPGESQGWGSLVGYRLWGRTELDTTEVTQQSLQIITHNEKQTDLVSLNYSLMFSPGIINLLTNIESFTEELCRDCCCCYVASVVSNSVQHHSRQPTRLYRPWDSPGKNTGVGCHFLLQCMKVKSESEVAQSFPTLSDPMVCSLPGSSVFGILQARVLEWGAIAFSDAETTND